MGGAGSEGEIGNDKRANRSFGWDSRPACAVQCKAEVLPPNQNEPPGRKMVWPHHWCKSKSAPELRGSSTSGKIAKYILCVSHFTEGLRLIIHWPNYYKQCFYGSSSWFYGRYGSTKGICRLFSPLSLNPCRLSKISEQVQSYK